MTVGRGVDPSQVEARNLAFQYHAAFDLLPRSVCLIESKTFNRARNSSGGVKRTIENAEARLDGESIADVLRSVGGQIRDSWCGPCFGQGPDALGPGERAITSFNRNRQNRMGRGSEGYLASPAVVASSALLGYMAPPSELGLEWDPDAYGV